MTTVQDDDDFGEIAAQNTVFGRVTPDQRSG